jgi:hypothetical protein
MNDNLTTNASNEAKSPAFLVGAVSGSVSLIMFKIIGGLKQVEFELKAISDHHAISVANDFHYRQGLIGRYYCETSNGKTFSVS